MPPQATVGVASSRDEAPASRRQPDRQSAAEFYGGDQAEVEVRVCMHGAKAIMGSGSTTPDRREPFGAQGLVRE
jgi:hypothetical protein